MLKNNKGFTAVEGLLIFLVLAVLGFGGYYVWSQNKSEPSIPSNSTSDTSTPSEAEESAPTESTTESKFEASYTPDSSFTANEKSELDKKVVQPIFDHAEQYKDKEGYNPLSTMVIKKYSDSEYAGQPDYAKYRYAVSIVYKSGAKLDFLHGEKDTIDWWVPECFDGQCGLTESFKTKYPEIVTKLEASGNTP